MCWSEADAFLTTVSEQHQIPALVAYIQCTGRPDFLRAWQTGDDGGRAGDATGQLFMVGSISKMLVAAGVMRLTAMGALDLDTPVGEYCELLPGEGSGSGTATIREMLSHTAGLARTQLRWQQDAREFESLEEYVRDLPSAHIRLRQNRGFTYSNLAYDVLGFVIERVVGMPFEEFIQTEFLIPLGMTDTMYELSAEHEGRVAVPHAGTGEYRGEMPRPPYCPAHVPSAGLYSTATDLSTWARFQLACGECGGVEIMPKECFGEMWKPHVETGQPDNPYAGLGCFVGGQEDEMVVGHGGREAGYNSLLLMAPQSDLHIVLLSNWHEAPIMPTGQHLLQLILTNVQQSVPTN